MTLIHNWMWYSWFTPKSHSLVCACSWQPPGWLSLHHVGPRDWAQVKSALAAPIPPAPFTFAISLIWNRLSFYVLWYPPCHETFNNWLIACLLPRLASMCSYVAHYAAKASLESLIPLSASTSHVLKMPCVPSPSVFLSISLGLGKELWLSYGFRQLSSRISLPTPDLRAFKAASHILDPEPLRFSKRLPNPAASLSF